MPDVFPFSDWVVREDEVVERLNSLDFEGSRRAFEREYQRRPRLEDGLARLLESYGFAARPTRPDAEDGAAPSRRCA